MQEAGVYIRTATPEDGKQIRENIRRTLASPDGRGARRKFEEAAVRHELMVVERYDSRDRTMRVVGFIEWHTKIDGTGTIRDAGTVGDELQTTIMKRLIREMLRLVSPSSLQVKVRQDLPGWNEVFDDIPGFRLEGREFSRPYWKNIWNWSGDTAQLNKRVNPPVQRRR
jgi:hypothetical protein